MSSLFSYELDESQIRLTLHSDGAVDYNESAWNDFEANFLQHHSHQSLNKFKFPEFNLNINRNIMLPIIFIAALVGVSAILLSFVDFKTNPDQQVEKELVPNPDNFKTEEVKTSAIVKKEVPKPVVQKQIIKNDSVPVKVETTVNPVVNSLANPTKTINQGDVNTGSQVETTRFHATDSANTISQNPPLIHQGTQNYTGQKRKRRRKVPTDQIETIKAPSLLEQQEASAKEPELELKLN